MAIVPIILLIVVIYIFLGLLTAVNMRDRKETNTE